MRCLLLTYFNILYSYSYSATLHGICISLFYFLLARTKPQERLAAQRPPRTVFCFYALLSILGQFLTHLGTLVLVTTAADAESSLNYGVDGNSTTSPSVLSEEFTPSVLNSAIFLLMLVQSVNTFGVNYRGAPYMTPLMVHLYYLIHLVFFSFFFVHPFFLFLFLLLPPFFFFFNFLLLLLLLFLCLDVSLSFLHRFFFFNFFFFFFFHRKHISLKCVTKKRLTINYLIINNHLFINY